MKPLPASGGIQIRFQQIPEWKSKTKHVRLRSGNLFYHDTLDTPLRIPAVLTHGRILPEVPPKPLGKSGEG